MTVKHVHSALRRSRAFAALCAVMIVPSWAAGCADKSPTAEPKTTVLVGLITKTENNPFFVKMRLGAAEKARQLGLEFQSFAGKVDGDNDSQVAAVENLIAAGAKGILITPSDSKAIVPALDKARAHGILVIALDTPTEPASSADATFATDNFQAGRLVGQWASKAMGPNAAQAKIALLDLSPTAPSVDVLRDQGFLSGFGIDVADRTRIGDENDVRIVGHASTQGNEEGGRTAMENLLQKDPAVNLVYTINEPAASGAHEALKAAGKTKDVWIVSIDGGCAGVQNVASGVIAATSMQFPLRMAANGVEAVAAFARTGVKPKPTPGLSFFNTGVNLITNTPVDGLESRDASWGLDHCWG